MEKRARFFRNIIANVVLIAALVVTIIYIVPLVAGSETVDEPIVRGDSSDRVAVMFLVTRDSDAINDILTTLYTHKKTATFFVSGSWVIENAAGLKNIVAAGHEIGNAGFFEDSNTKLTAAKVREEIQLNHSLILRTAGVNTNLFLPIHNNFPIGFVDTARAMGYTTITGRNARIERGATAAQILLAVTEDVEGGDLLLLPASGNAANVLGKVLEHIMGLELRSVTVSDVL